MTLEPYYETENGKLYLGDCLEVMEHLIAKGIKVDAIITDPPYGTTNSNCDKRIPIPEMWNCINRLLKGTFTPIILFGAEPYSSMLRLSNDTYKYDWKYIKTHPKGHLNANKQPLRDIEDILVFYEEQCLYNPQMSSGHKRKVVKAKHKKGKSYEGYNSFDNHSDYDSTERYPTQVLIYGFEVGERTGHPFQKPKELISDLVKTYTNEFELVLDFTSGSGTTAEVCEILNRKWICIELDKYNCDLTVKRLQNIQQILDL